MNRSDINYGVLTTLSKGVNRGLGDKTGRTVSRRTTHGFKDLLGLSDDVSDVSAEHLIHGVMIGSGALVLSKNRSNQLIGVGLLALLVICYQAGE